MQRVTQLQLLDAYRIALIRWGSYSKITIDAVTRDEFGEIIIYFDDTLMFQGTPRQFREHSAQFL